MPNISIIVALADDRAIGRNNSLLCYVPGDLKRFKQLTSGHTVIMGRKTLESLPNGPLPNRRNIVVTHHIDSLPDGCEGASSLDEAVAMCENESDEVFILGGGQIYSQSLPLASKLYLTQIHASFPDADTFFPAFNPANYRETFREDHQPTDKCEHPFSFVNMQRI